MHTTLSIKIADLKEDRHYKGSESYSVEPALVEQVRQWIWQKLRAKVAINNIGKLLLSSMNRDLLYIATLFITTF